MTTVKPIYKLNLDLINGLTITELEDMEKEDIIKVLKIAKDLGCDPEYTAFAIEDYLIDHGEKVYEFSIDDPARWETLWELRIYFYDDKYILKYMYTTEEYYTINYRVYDDLKSALKAVISDLREIIEELEDNYTIDLGEEIWEETDEAIKTVEEEIEWIKKQYGV